MKHAQVEGKGCCVCVNDGYVCNTHTAHSSGTGLCRQREFTRGMRSAPAASLRQRAQASAQGRSAAAAAVPPRIGRVLWRRLEAHQHRRRRRELGDHLPRAMGGTRGRGPTRWCLQLSLCCLACMCGTAVSSKPSVRAGTLAAASTLRRGVAPAVQRATMLPPSHPGSAHLHLQLGLGRCRVGGVHHVAKRVSAALKHTHIVNGAVHTEHLRELGCVWDHDLRAGRGGGWRAGQMGAENGRSVECGAPCFC